MVLFGVIVRKCVGYSMHLDIAGGSPEWISTCFKGRGWFEGGSQWNCGIGIQWEHWVIIQEVIWICGILPSDW